MQCLIERHDLDGTVTTTRMSYAEWQECLTWFGPQDLKSEGIAFYAIYKVQRHKYSRKIRFSLFDAVCPAGFVVECEDNRLTLVVV